MTTASSREHVAANARGMLAEFDRVTAEYDRAAANPMANSAQLESLRIKRYAIALHALHALRRHVGM